MVFVDSSLRTLENSSIIVTHVPLVNATKQLTYFILIISTQYFQHLKFGSNFLKCCLLFLFLISFTLEIHCFLVRNVLSLTDINLRDYFTQMQILIAILPPNIHPQSRQVVHLCWQKSYWKMIWRHLVFLMKIPGSSELPCKYKEALYKSFTYRVSWANKRFNNDIASSELQ